MCESVQQFLPPDNRISPAFEGKRAFVQHGLDINKDGSRTGNAWVTDPVECYSTTSRAGRSARPSDGLYDAIVVGSGQGGNPLAKAFAAAGRRTALIERTHVGGTCVNEGCTPTKTMVASARVAYLARRARDYGVSAGPIAIDMPRVRERKRKIVDRFRGSSERGIA